LHLHFVVVGIHEFTARARAGNRSMLDWTPKLGNEEKIIRTFDSCRQPNNGTSLWDALDFVRTILVVQCSLVPQFAHC
jgi:hypothetical protein